MPASVGESCRVVRLSRRTPSSSSRSRTYLESNAFDLPALRAAAENPPASTTCTKACMRVSVSITVSARRTIFGKSYSIVFDLPSPRRPAPAARGLRRAAADSVNSLDRPVTCPGVENLGPSSRIHLCHRANGPISRLAQIRTCLWPRAGRWGSGDKRPGNVIGATGSRS